MMNEEDAFGPDYDEDAKLPATKTESVVAGSDTVINTENGSATIPAGATTAEELTYSVAPTDVPSNITAQVGETLTAYEVTLVDENGNKVTTTAPVEATIFVGKNLIVTKLYHNDQEIDFNYDPTTGYVTFKTTSFSPFTVVTKAAADLEVITTVEELEAAAANGGYYKLAADLVVEDKTFVVPTGVSFTLDTTGKSIEAVSTVAAASKLFEVKGEMTICGTGTIAYTASTPDTEWGEGKENAFPGYANNTIANLGKVTVNGATLINRTAKGGASYVIDCYASSTLVVNSGTIQQAGNDVAIRTFTSSANKPINVTINDGKISGCRAIWIQLASSNTSVAPIVNLTVNGGTLTSTTPDIQPAIYSYSYGNSFAGVTVKLNAGTFNGNVAFSGGTKGEVREKVIYNAADCTFADGYSVFNYGDIDSVYYVVATAEELLARVAEGHNVILATDIDLADATIKVAEGVAISVDLNGKKLSGASVATGKNPNLFEVYGTLSLENGTVSLKHEGANMAWNNCTQTVYVGGNGALNVKNARIENLGGTDMAYAIDMTNAKTITVNVENSVLASAYIAVRVFNNSSTGMNNVTIENTEMIGASRAFWVHIYSNTDTAGKGTRDHTLNLDIYGNNNTFTVTNPKYPAPICYGFDDGYFYDVEGNFVCAAADTAAGLKAAVEAGYDVFLSSNITLTETLVVSKDAAIVLDLNGKTISQTKECTASYSMIENDGTLTIIGNGKLSFNDTGAGDPDVGWASYTLRNAGTLIVENGTIEHLGTQTYNGNNAIFHYSGTTVINGGVISAAYSRSLRQWNGSVTINGGEFDGQVWVQAMNDCSFTVNGGSFKPATYGKDGSSIFVTNNTKNVTVSVTGGDFATKFGCSDATKIAGCITGGNFTESAKANTNAALFAN